MERRKSSKSGLLHLASPVAPPWKRRPLEKAESCPARSIKRIKLRLPGKPPSEARGNDNVEYDRKQQSQQGKSMASTGPSNDDQLSPSFTLAGHPTAAPTATHIVASKPAPSITDIEVKAPPRSTTEQAMMHDIVRLQAFLQGSASRRRQLQPDPAPVASSSNASLEWSPHEILRPAQYLPPLWASSHEELSAVTDLCPAASKSKGKTKESPVMVKASRSGIGRGSLLTRRPMLGHAAAGRIGRDGQLVFDLVSPGKRLNSVKASKADDRTEYALDRVKEEPAASSSSSLIPTPAAPAAKDSDSTTSTLHDLIAGDTTQLALHRAWQHRALLYLFLTRPSTEGSDTAEKGGLSLLPCQLPNGVGAVAVGWARVIGAQVINADVKEGIGGSSRPRRGEGIKIRWSLTVKLDEESWWLPCVLDNERSDTAPSGGGSGWTSMRAVQHLLHTNTASPSVKNVFPSKPTSILQSIPCPSCHRATPRLRWSCYHCKACDAFIPARTPSLTAGDVDFGSSPLPTIGPRMDNGRAAWDSEVVQRKLSTLLSDGGKEAVKCAEYYWLSSPTPADGAASAPSLVHLLSSGAWTKASKGALSWLLSSAMPYERTNGGNTFQLGVLLADSDSCKKQAACCNAKEAGPLLHPLDMPDLTLAQRLLDLVDSIEQRSSASLFALGSRKPRVAHRALLRVAGCVGAKHRLELPGAEATYLHLGGPATLAVTTATPDVARKATKTILNAMVANGDILCVPATKAKKRKEKKRKKEAQKSSEEAAAETSSAPTLAPPAPAVTITIEAKSLCIGLLLLAD